MTDDELSQIEWRFKALEIASTVSDAGVLGQSIRNVCNDARRLLAEVRHLEDELRAARYEIRE